MSLLLLLPSGLNNPVLAPGTASLSLTGVASELGFSYTLQPGTGALSISGVVPVASLDTILTPATRALSISGVAPTDSFGTVLTPDVRAMTIAGLAPATSLGLTITPDTRSLVMRSDAPTLGVPGAAQNLFTIYLIDPRRLSLHDWCDSMTLALEPVVHAPRLHDDDWQDWAARLALSPHLGQHHTPSPYQFDDWREWAIRFNSTLSSAGQ